MERELIGEVGEKYLILRLDLRCGFLCQRRGYGTGKRMPFGGRKPGLEIRVTRVLTLLLEGWMCPIHFKTLYKVGVQEMFFE